MANNKEQDPELIKHMIHHVFNEQILLNHYELDIYKDKFAKLCSEKISENFDDRLNKAIEHLGAPPRFYMVPDDYQAQIPLADNYPEAALKEVLDVYDLARKSVIRAHLFLSGYSLLVADPELTSEALNDPVTRDYVMNKVQAAFWEHAETAYIRLYSYWDRVGQVLDFAFFNIRKFDQNGFNSVMDRIHTNTVPMIERMKSSGSWQRLRAFQKSEKENGLKWLLPRRNLIIHSLHLHEMPKSEGVFNSQFNHLDAAHREKLRPKSPMQESELLVGHLSKASELFPDFLSIIEFSPDRKRDNFIF